MANLVLAIFAVVLAYGAVYFLGTHGCRLWGETVRWFDGEPTIGERLKSAALSTGITVVGSFAAVLVASTMVPNEQPTRRVTVLPDSAAERAGIQTGDVITKLDSKPVRTFDEIRLRVLDSDGTISVELLRGDQTLQVQVEVPESRLGVQSVMVEKGRTVSETFGYAWDVFRLPVVQMVAPRATSAQLAGPVGLAREAKRGNQPGSYTLLFVILLGWTWVAVPLVHGLDVVTLFLHRKRRGEMRGSRDVFNLLVLGAGILVLAGIGLIQEMRPGAPSVSPLLELATKAFGFALTLASFTALKRHLPLPRAATLTVLGAFIAPVLWIGTLIWVRRKEP